MDKFTYKELIDYEVYRPYREAKKRMTFLDKIWCKYVSPSSNAVFLIRKKQYLESKGKVSRLFSRFYRVKLMRRYGIHVDEGTVIDKGLRIAHPTSICITLCTIGKNFTIYQNCTIGQKKYESGQYPTIGNNVTMYANSNIIGNCIVGDDVVLGAGSLIIKDSIEPGIYVGSPAKWISHL